MIEAIAPAIFVSVIIPTYNRNDLLFDRALPSVLLQTQPVGEVLIVADGMEGDLLEDLEGRFRAAQSETDVRLRLWNLDRQLYPDGPEWGRWGLYAVNARNFGIDHAEGDWLLLLDDDDELLPSGVSDLLGHVSDDVDFVYGRSMTYKGGDPIDQTYGAWPPGDGNVTHGAFLMRSGMPWRYALDSYELWRNSDADLWIRMFAGGVRFRHVPFIVHKYHRNYP